MSNIHDYVADPEVRRLSWQARAGHTAWDAKPNPGHQALVTLLAILTQNIDQLHQRAGNSRSLVVELHGTMFDTVCLDCDDRRPMREALSRVAAGAEDPECLVCGGILKSATI